MSSYGERLLKARKKKELTREELGKLCGITGRTIQNAMVFSESFVTFLKKLQMSRD